MDSLLTLKRIIGNVEKVILGKRESVELILMALICKGHVLIEDVPGVGKTSVVNALSKSINGSFRRIQFTPDIMPSDITGFSVYNQRNDSLEYKQGAVFSQFVLADEINRTSPKTQSSLLEVMEENQVTVDGLTYPMPKPFMVLATQNPIEYLGTYPLPEAQLDRFFMKITIGYPTRQVESRILSVYRSGDPLAELTPVATTEDIVEIQGLVEKVFVNLDIGKYIVDIVANTRALQEHVSLGASPRGSICLLKAAQAWALYNGRDYIIIDDVQYMAKHVLEHRILLNQEAKFKNISAQSVIEYALSKAIPPKI